MIPLATDAPRAGPGGGRALSRRDYLAADGRLRLEIEAVARFADPAPGSLFAHPAWLKTYAEGELVVVHGLQPGVPKLVFLRDGGGLFHQGRLLSFEAALVEDLARHLLAQTGAAFAVFEDIDLDGAMTPGLRRLVFHYQNNWRLDLRGAWAAKALVADTRRKTRALKRDVPDISIRFEHAPTSSTLEPVFGFAKARFEAKKGRYGIDERERERLLNVSALVGHGTVVRSGHSVIAADLICIAGEEAYFLTHGYHHDFARHRLGLVCLLHSIEQCQALGLKHLNLLWGDLPYKARLGSDRVPLTTVVLSRSAVSAFHPGHLRTVLRFGWFDLKRRLKPFLSRLPFRRAGAPEPSGR